MSSGLICLSIACPTAEAALSAALGRNADLVEIRFDAMSAAERDALCERLSTHPELKVIATFRPQEQGGHQNLSIEERLRFWRRSGPQFAMCDIEEDIFDTVSFLPHRILSHHEFNRIPAGVEHTFRRLAAKDPDVVKLAVKADDAADAVAVWRLLGTDTKAVVIAMGDGGKWTRILGPAYGAEWTYAASGNGTATAEGQVTIDDLTDVYRVKELSRDTTILGIIGDPVSRSYSPYIHNPALYSKGIDAVFIPFLVKGAGEFLKEMVRPETSKSGLRFGGLSVTMPHKQAIIPFLDGLEPEAKTIGAVNTVEVRNGRLIGHNTDAYGFITPLKQKLGGLSGMRAAVFGCGGAARAVIYALRREGVEVKVFARDPEKAAALAAEFTSSYGDIEEGRRSAREYDVVVNATPIGMHNNTAAGLLSADDIRGIKLAFDLVTKPTDTPLIAEAKKADVGHIGGAEMLLAQGVKQFEIWTGIDAPADVMEAGLLDRMALL
ncbi:MAG: shikimate dehydrogenase [Acidobacteria bacterium]|nr:shikimate dehydrogenase [Acidobacteriota bacterium]